MDCTDTPVVALVCSADGLDALAHVVARLPIEFPAAVLMGHQQPGANSMLASILTRHSTLPVVSFREGQALTASCVLVAQHRGQILVTAQDSLALMESASLGPDRSAEPLPTNLALALGPQAIVVLLSGHDLDVAIGASAVDHFGGRVTIRKEARLAASSIPRIKRPRHDH